MENKQGHFIFSAREEPSPDKNIPKAESPKHLRRVSSDRAFSSTKKPDLIDIENESKSVYFIKPRVVF